MVPDSTRLDVPVLLFTDPFSRDRKLLLVPTVEEAKVERIEFTDKGIVVTTDSPSRLGWEVFPVGRS